MRYEKDGKRRVTLKDNLGGVIRRSSTIVVFLSFESPHFESSLDFISLALYDIRGNVSFVKEHSYTGRFSSIKLLGGR